MPFWPERVTVFLGAMIIAVLCLVGSISSTAWSQEWFDALIDIFGGTIALKILLPIWILLRTFDSCFIEHRPHRGHGQY